ncbi:alpha/beta fold hydrolase [Actinomadura decatromicini]|uniref:Alpha/beta hydrolase n=1 Tax=Actinomadura decatromicini TaxID=2604572 RepID=A0A5D3FI34_9ACTN|nr:alpha/beta hydrolase [Actinomadura decatromicini]TYK46965.1 alpha/beta hydrolase [Actinomadura decatromicini]
MQIRRSYADTPFGQIHFAECGTGTPVLFLHQTPRSWTEYIDVLPLAGQHVRAIAMDTLGFGQSARTSQTFSIELFADGVAALLDALSLERVAVVGHHTGAVIALETAARYPARVDALVLSAMPHVTPERRLLVRDRPPIDHVDPEPDGGHLTELWRRRGAFYEKGEEAHLTRCVIDALGVIDRVEEGHVAVNEYPMEKRIPLVAAPVHLICGAGDGYSMPDQERLAELLGATFRLIEGAGVSLPEQQPAAFADEVVKFVTAR